MTAAAKRNKIQIQIQKIKKKFECSKLDFTLLICCAGSEISQRFSSVERGEERRRSREIHSRHHATPHHTTRQQQQQQQQQRGNSPRTRARGDRPTRGVRVGVGGKAAWSGARAGQDARRTGAHCSHDTRSCGARAPLLARRAHRGSAAQRGAARLARKTWSRLALRPAGAGLAGCAPAQRSAAAPHRNAAQLGACEAA